MKIFISYASEEAQLAERINLALRSENHEVFFDRSDLREGEAFDAAIRSGINKCDLVLFLISPGSICAGSYALTELSLASHRWSHPSGHVLPVIVGNIDLESIPALLRAVNFLRPKGDIPAEIVAAIARIAWRRQRRRGRRISRLVLVGFAVFLLGLLYWRAEWGGSPLFSLSAGHKELKAPARSAIRMERIVPVETKTLQAIALPDNEGFKVLRERRWLDLRDWKSSVGGPAKLEHLIEARRLTSQNSFFLTYSAFGEITFYRQAGESSRNISTVEYFREKGTKQEEKTTYKVAVDVPAGISEKPLSISVVAVYESSYTNLTQEDFDTRISYPVGILDVTVSFPHNKPPKGAPRLLELYRNDEGAIIEGFFENEIEDPLQTRDGSYLELHVQVTNPHVGRTYSIEWDW